MQNKGRASNPKYPYLMPLKPYGERSGDLEVLTSFICRHSEQLHEGTSSFCRTLLYHFLDDPKLKTKRIVSNFERRTSNGMGVSAVRYAEAFKKASNNTLDPTNLTFLPIKNLCDVTSRGLQKTNRVWCNLCWLEDSQLGRTPYIRQYWIAEPTLMCVHHQTALREDCPTCGGTQSVLPNFPKQWICDYCGLSLYEGQSDEKIEKGCFEAKWKSAAIYNLIGRLNSTDFTIEPTTLKDSLENLERCTKLSIPDIADRLQIGEGFFNSALLNKPPYFRMSIEICYRLDIPPDQFLFNHDNLTSPDIWRKKEQPSFFKQSRPSINDRKTIKQKIDSIIKDDAKPARRVSKIAKGFGVSYNYLSYHFPEEYKILRDRYIKWLQFKKRDNHLKRINKITKAALKLMSQDIYPSDRKLRALNLVKPSDLRRKEIISVLRALQSTYNHL